MIGFVAKRFSLRSRAPSAPLVARPNPLGSCRCEARRGDLARRMSKPSQSDWQTRQAEEWMKGEHIPSRASSTAREWRHFCFCVLRPFCSRLTLNVFRLRGWMLTPRHHAVPLLALLARASGLSEDELIAATFGKETKDDLSETELAYADKVLSMMEQKIQDVKARDAKARSFILRGKKLYAKGSYGESIPSFEEALACTTADTFVGGEAKMWLALAYDGCGQMDKAKVIYTELKEGHPLPSIRSQAGDLLYLLEAPKLKIREEERLKIPDLTQVDEFRNRRKTQRVPPRQAPKKVTKKSKPTWEEQFMRNSPLVRTFRNRYVQVAFVVISAGLSVYSAVYIKP